MNQITKVENFAVVQLEKKKGLLEIESVKNNLSRTESLIAKMGANKTIRDIPDRDIRVVNNEEKDYGLIFRAGILAKGIARDFSIRNVDKAEAFRFYDILKKYYSGFTLDEVRGAFELALVGELDAYLPKTKTGEPDKNHYQVFSVEFVTKILNAFKSYKGKVWGKVYSIADKEPILISEEEKSEAKNLFIEVVRDLFADYCKGEDVLILFPRTICDYLIERGFIEDRELTQADYNKALISIRNNKNLDPFSRSGALEAFKNGETDKLKAEAENIKSQELILTAFSRMKINQVEI